MQASDLGNRICSLALPAGIGDQINRTIAREQADTISVREAK